MTNWTIRDEREEDAAAVYTVNALAFGRPDEARLVQRLHAEGAVALSLVAEASSGVAGHILFSLLAIDTLDGRELPALALGPMAVQPQQQGCGMGSALIRAGLARGAAAGYTAVIVLGHPGYYPRFGFQPAQRWGISNNFGIEGAAFMALELQPGALAGAAGRARYHPAFTDVT